MLALAALVLLASLFADRPASAAAVLNAAAANANAGLSACSSSRGKALYNCVADVLERMSNEISSVRVPETQRALQTAATRLRSASSKAEAVSAITQCQAAIAGALRQVKATGHAPGWGDSGLASIAGVLARAAKLIQAKG
ncbi:hypothetical protein JQ633_06010 [Bradyrhizobium tropiciagri]|nr:hypothetical protein [Bradyrhizobium tropiciagri]